MKIEPSLQADFDLHKCCVILPTYNNAGTLREVVNEVLLYTRNVIVINDGSTDETAQFLNHYKDLQVVHLPTNKGKGNALKTGFAKALKSGFSYAITMDSDGQHFPEDLHVFLNAIAVRETEDPEILVIGSREMDHPDIPSKSNFGNRCSSFWFWVETGIRLKDTQCGYRLYPLHVVKDLSLYTSRFELEIEVIVKAAWKGTDVKNLPVKVYYDPRERVTHFRPFQDVTRITLLNIWFVFTAIFYIAPRNLLRRLNPFPRTFFKKTFSSSNLPLE